MTDMLHQSAADGIRWMTAKLSLPSRLSWPLDYQSLLGDPNSLLASLADQSLGSHRLSTNQS